MGNRLLSGDDAGAVWLAPWLDHIQNDVRYAFRQLHRARRRGRTVVHQLLTDAMVVALIGGALGLAVAVVALPLLVSQLPPDLLMGRVSTLQPMVLLVALALTLFIGVLLGLAPALAALRMNLRARSPAVGVTAQRAAACGGVAG